MLSYQYVARNPVTGERVKAKVEAQSETEAIKLIRGQGLMPIDIKPEDAALSAFTNHVKKVRAKDRVLFARQLSTLINAGLPLVQSLRQVSQQTTSKPLKVIIDDLVSQVEGGVSFTVALSKYPDVFNQVFISLVSAGESSGTLDSALERIAIQQEKDADVVKKVRGAMVYPLVVVIVMLAVVMFMLVKVLPQVQTLYVSFPGATLPLPTRIMLDISHFVIKFWWIVVILVAGFGFGGWRYSKTASGTRMFDLLKLRMPPFAALMKKVYMARFARTGSTLVSAGVPLLQMLNITSKAVSNTLISDSIKKASEKVKGGKALSDSLNGDPNFLPLVPSMIHIGEQSGAMEKMMSKTAEYYEKDVDDAIKNIQSLLEPIMMVLLGIVALFIIAAVLLPIYNLAGSGAINQGGV